MLCAYLKGKYSSGSRPVLLSAERDAGERRSDLPQIDWLRPAGADQFPRRNRENRGGRTGSGVDNVVL